MRTEAQLSSLVMNRLDAELAHAQRIESTTGSGIPDINCVYQGNEFWIETKILSPGHGPFLRPYQHSWMHRRLNAGGKYFIFGKGAMHIFVYSPKHFPGFKRFGKYIELTGEPWMSYDMRLTGINAFLASI